MAPESRPLARGDKRLIHSLAMTDVTIQPEAGENDAPAAAPTPSPVPPLPNFDVGQILGIADALPMPVAMVDPAQRYTFVNQAFARFFEVRRRDILGRTMREVMGDRAYGDREALIAAGLAGERQWFAAEFQHPTRGLLAVQTDYVPQTALDGTRQGMIVILQDVTEQRVAERSLRESEARFRRIADSAPVLMWVTRLDRSRDFVNEAYVEFAGLNRDEARTHDWSKWIHPDDLERIGRESIAGEATLKPFTLEGRFRRADGEYRWLRSVSRPRFGPDGQFVGFIGAAFDITAIKQGELELRRQVDARTAELSASESRFRAIFDSAQTTIVLAERDGTIIQVNQHPRAWSDQSADALTGQLLWDAPSVADQPSARDALRRMAEAAASGQVAHEEVSLSAPNGRAMVLDIVIQPVRDERAQFDHLLLEARDVTELKLTQEQLRQSQKMEALGQLTGGIAHDFNNLLTVVVGGLDLIVKREEDPKLKRYAVNALEAAERGARLTAQLLAFSRVQRLEVRPIVVAPLIENMRPLLRNVLGPAIEKRFDLSTDKVPVLADPTQLELAVLNLAINARDAMPEGGILTVRTERRTVQGDPDVEDGEYLELSIGDSGCGMPPEVVERAFEPFFTTKEVGKGTGLGLSMVYGVARQSGGTARIESKPGEGTCIRLLLRRASETATGDPEPIGNVAARKTKDPAASVLVVDDDPDVRDFIVAGLEELGYVVSEAADGATGLAAWRESRPNLVVLDYLMPGMSGAEVASIMLAEFPAQRLLFVSGYSETDAIKRVAPLAAMLAKPFRAEALDVAVRNALATSG